MRRPIYRDWHKADPSKHDSVEELLQRLAILQEIDERLQRQLKPIAEQENGKMKKLPSIFARKVLPHGRNKKIAITMPEEIYDKIAFRADLDNMTFSKKAVELIDCGLFDYEESERHDKK
jgi:hypothetical protein